VKDFFVCLAEHLLNSTALQSAVGSRVYPHLLPQSPILPSIVYIPISTSYGNALQRQTGFVRQRVQFSVHNTTFGKARETGRILKAVLQDFKGDMCGTVIQATHILSDLTTGGNTMTNYKTEEYMNILEFQFEYMEE
jgi:hypothetical protein